MMQSDLGPPVSPSSSITPSLSSQPSRKRKATSGSRGVATLTPEQLAKKRANDREAQRAIRERTKQQIENLERRIQELTSQQPYQELQAVIRQKDAIQAENDEIRRRLASIMSIIQPVVGAQGLTDLATAAQHNVQTSLQQNNAFQQEPYMNGQHRNYSHSPTLQQADASNYPPFGQDDGSTENRAWHTSRDALQMQRDNLHRGLEMNDSGERLSFNFLLDNHGQRAPDIPTNQPNSQHHSSPDSRSAYPSLAGTFTDLQPQPTSWTTLPKNTEPTCPLDSILLNFLQARQRDAGNGASQASLAGPAYPSVSSLLNPAAAGTGHHNPRIDPLSQLMTDIISKFPNISGLPEQAAVLFMMFISMRWQVNPTQENYDRMPEWLTPRPSQLFTPHPAWIDQLPWPRMRDKLVANYQDYAFENWFIPFTSGLSVNWPYDPIDCLLSTSEKDDPMINPVFERHIRRLENWSLGPIFADSFPALVDTVRIRPGEPRRMDGGAT